MRVCRWQSPTLWRAGPPPYAKGLHQFSYWHPVVLKMDDLEERSLCLKLSSREKQNFLHWMPVDLFFALAFKFLAGDSGFTTNAPAVNSAGLWCPSEISLLSLCTCVWLRFPRGLALQPLKLQPASARPCLCRQQGQGEARGDEDGAYFQETEATAGPSSPSPPPNP